MNLKNVELNKFVNLKPIPKAPRARNLRNYKYIDQSKFVKIIIIIQFFYKYLSFKY